MGVVVVVVWAIMVVVSLLDKTAWWTLISECDDDGGVDGMEMTMWYSYCVVFGAGVRAMHEALIE